MGGQLWLVVGDIGEGRQGWSVISFHGLCVSVTDCTCAKPASAIVAVIPQICQKACKKFFLLDSSFKSHFQNDIRQGVWWGAGISNAWEKGRARVNAYALFGGGGGVFLDSLL